ILVPSEQDADLSGRIPVPGKRLRFRRRGSLRALGAPLGRGGVLRSAGVSPAGPARVPPLGLRADVWY
ncbi:MAG TPA: hypothetical protein VNH18_13215, partial [Bryobacteraceae bacterium]|nr:hypothetical protein [Bryobacteraceae bacterium]